MDVKNSVLKYKLIAKEIEDKVKNGILQKGSLMNSELTTQKEYGVSRVTVRKAYKILAEKGIIRTVHGVGTFINDLYSQDWTWMSSFSSEVSKTGHIPSTIVEKFQIVKADSKVASQLGIENKEECFFFKRVRFIDKQPIWITSSYIPVHLVPEFTAEYLSIAGVTQSIFKVLELNFNIRCVRGMELYEATTISDRDAEVLNLDYNKPVIMKAFVAYDSSNRAIVYENTTMAQSISKIRTKGDEIE